MATVIRPEISKKRDYTVIFNNYDSFCFLNNNNFKNNNISYEKVSYNIPELSNTIPPL